MNIGSGAPQSKSLKSPNVAASATAYLAGGSPDVPPDMALLLQELEEDFTVNKTIDQWTYINRREEIMQLINRLHQQQNSNVALDPLKLEKILLPRKVSEPSTFNKQSLTSMLGQRAESCPADSAFMVLDAKGKAQQSILWEKLYLKSAKVAHELKHRTHFKSINTVALLYKESEVCEFAVALFGCFMANVTAIPIHNDISLTEMFDILNTTSSLLVLMSESVSKELEKLGTASVPLVWPSKIWRLRTTDLGSARKSDLESLLGKTKKENNGNVNDLAYVEFSRSPVGELRGIALSHRTISHQMNCLDTSLLSLPESGGNLIQSPKFPKRARKVFLATIDIRLSVGLIIGIMFSMYSGNLLVWAPPKVMEVQGLYANIISKCHANLLLADFLGLKRVTYDYQKAPNSTRYFSKTQRVDFSLVKWVLVDALTVDGEFIEVLSERYLKPLGCPQSRNAIIPMLTLSEYGGMVISMRDWLGRFENMGIEVGGSSNDDLSSVIIDRKALSQNRVCVIETSPLEADEQCTDTLRVDAFGYPIPDATLAVVNPELSSVVLKGELGEIWIDSPCLSGGFYGMRKESKLIFHAKCRGAGGTLDMEFLRTGLLGFTYNGKVYILGLYEDRIRQRFSWMDHKFQKKLSQSGQLETTMRYHYSSHLLATLANEVRQVYDCTIFDIFIGNEYLPVAIVEAEIARKVIDDVESSSGNNPKSKDKFDYNAVPLNESVLNAIAKRCFDALNKRHQLRLYCVVVVDCDTLPKIMRSGGLEIANMLCKKKFLEGTLRSDFIKFFVNQSISMIPRGEDVIGGIWSPFASQLRNSSLQNFPAQYSTFDYREKTIDDKTGAALTDFKSIIDIFKFRVTSSGDAIAFQNIDTSGKTSSKPLTWKKLEQRVYAACQYIIEKTTLRASQYVILMYSLSEEFIVILYACFMLGIIPIPMLPFDSNRIGEDFPAYVGVIKDFDVQEVFVNDDVERFMKNGPVADALKKMNHRRVKPLRIKNTSKLTKLSSVAHLNSKIAKYQADAKFRDELTTALIWLNFTSDHYRVGATLSHKSIVNICKVFKETCNLSSKSSIVGCVRHSAGIGFVQAALLGVYLGTTTYLSSPVNFAGNPLSFFLSLAKYKVKDVFVTEQMLKYAVAKFTPKGFNLSHLKNMMINTDGRVEIDLLRKIANIFLLAKLNTASMSAVYNHCFNPIISTRSYMTVAPVDLFLDPIALRQGYISIVNQAEHPNALRVQDSGMVPVCTEIAIVNPETCNICKEGEFGEIWVNSEANLISFTNGPKGPVDNFIKKQFVGKILGDKSDRTYLRTGDLGFLHHISITKNRSNEAHEEVTSFQPLFVLGKISDTFEVMGLHHFPLDIESTIEACHPDIYKNGSCIFKCADYTIVVCEARRSRSLSALVPMIVNTVFSKHHLIVDIVAFIKRGEFPISRLGTKQRARIVDAWVQGIIPLSVQYGVNYGENSMIKLVKQIDEVAKSNPYAELRNPAQEYYDYLPESVFENGGPPLNLNAGDESHRPKATFDMCSLDSDDKR
ncbi:hypothetical protein HF325_003705 [Metschnikowia pulcherrima]|uniref:Uncharacterized protein n=1 Tax=Metschnikowia pulcherrima TaxID=27326 RepID=A0A8H7GTB7_9ASCO|nr:hypothetical protein HF325_003705 [Metschnikowia pulcherrima]